MAFDTGEEIPGKWIVYNSYAGDFIDDETEGDAEGGVGMDEVCCAVYGVADEGWGGGEFGFAFDEGFFADEGVGWVGGGEALGDHCFDCAVGLGDEVGGYKWGVASDG